ncbi:MAG TPA: hypothetical protein VHK91_02685 [Flavisolibacter sp.]|nr:hypothetical protein [Flavisolibacter sp.]
MSGRGDNNQHGSSGRGASNQSNQGFSEGQEKKSNHGRQTGGQSSEAQPQKEDQSSNRDHSTRKTKK